MSSQASSAQCALAKAFAASAKSIGKAPKKIKGLAESLNRNAASQEDNCKRGEEYFDWYNFHHHHEGLNGYMASTKQSAL